MKDRVTGEIWRQTDLAMMAICLDLARQAATLGEIPVGALITFEGQVVAKDHNRCEASFDPTAHAERLVISEATQLRKSQRLDGCTLYTTLEPCIMCAGAIVLARFDRLVFGVADQKSGATRSLYRLLEDSRLNHQVQVTSGVSEESSTALLQGFFRQRRKSEI